MEYPARDDIGTKLLILIYENGGWLYQMRSCDTYNLLADMFNIDPEARRITRDEYYGDGSIGLLWPNLVQWAREDLAKTGWLDRISPHGVWRLTPKGVRYAQSLLQMRERVSIAMRQFKDYVETRRAFMQKVGTGNQPQ